MHRSVTTFSRTQSRWRLLPASIFALVFMMVWVGSAHASAPVVTVDQSANGPSNSLVIGTSQPNELILIAANGWPATGTAPTVTVDGSAAALIAFQASSSFNSGGASVFQFVAPSAGPHTVVVGEGGYCCGYFLNFAASFAGATNAGLTFASSSSSYPGSNAMTQSITTSIADQYIFATSTHNTGLSHPFATTWTGTPVSPTLLQALHIGTGIDASIAGFDAPTPGTYSATSSDPYTQAGGVIILVAVSPANSPPPVSADDGSIVVNEGETAANTGTYSDPNAGDSVALSASVGTVTKTGTNSGTWSWSFGTTDGPAESQTVTITADDGHGGVTSTSFALTVMNVAPTVNSVTVSNGSGTSCIAGNEASLNFSFSDPGSTDSPWQYDINWGDSSTHTTGTVNSQGSIGPFTHTYAAGTYTPSVTVTDDDYDQGSKSASVAAVSFLYNMTGILQPFNADGTSIFKFGSTIPVKVQILDCNDTPVSGLSPQIGRQLKSSVDPGGSIDETISTSAADTGTTLRYDPTAGQYIYNLASKSLPDGSAMYYVYVREPHSTGKTNTGASAVGQSYQQFGLKLK
jgi:hypothetical protein